MRYFVLLGNFGSLGTTNVIIKSLEYIKNTPSKKLQIVRTFEEDIKSL